MKFNKLTCLISASLLILLVACQNQTKPDEKAETNQENITENASETPSSEEISPEIPSPETPSPSPVTPPKDTFEESQSISIKCGTEQEFQGLQILAECPTDTDKDDRPDKESSNVTFSNPFEQVIYLTFPTDADALTALIQPKSSIVRQIDNNKFDSQTQSFQEIKVGLGKIKVSALPENTFSESL